jgi:hypothetical protein
VRTWGVQSLRWLLRSGRGRGKKCKARQAGKLAAASKQGGRKTRDTITQVHTTSPRLTMLTPQPKHRLRIGSEDDQAALYFFKTHAREARGERARHRDKQRTTVDGIPGYDPTSLA